MHWQPYCLPNTQTAPLTMWSASLLDVAVRSFFDRSETTSTDTAASHPGASVTLSAYDQKSNRCENYSCGNSCTIWNKTLLNIWIYSEIIQVHGVLLNHSFSIPADWGAGTHPQANAKDTLGRSPQQLTLKAGQAVQRTPTHTEKKLIPPGAVSDL